MVESEDAQGPDPEHYTESARFINPGFTLTYGSSFGISPGLH